MIIKGSIIIDKPREEVVSYFRDPDLLGEYQDGFVKKELLQGMEGEKGAISKMHYKMGNRDLILTETIIENKLPDYFEAFYSHQHMDNTMVCTFVEISPGQTSYEYTYEYIRISWIMPKLMALLFPRMFKKPAEKWLRQFKEFVENQ